jgi:beta-N-acetylhexosaminidase
MMKKFFIVLILVLLFSVHTAYAEEVPIQDKIDQMIMIGFRGTSVGTDTDIAKIIDTTNIGGVILFDYDTATKSYKRNITDRAQLTTLTSELQKRAKTKLFIAIDQEGGLVNRLKPTYGFPTWMSARTIALLDESRTRREYATLAQTLSSVGVNVNFGPVVDVATNDRSTLYTQKRIYSKNVYTVLHYARLWIDEHTKSHILSVAKHYPGIGSLVFDTHNTIGMMSTFNTMALIPYNELILSKVLDGVMVGHVIVSGVDTLYPASLSAKHIHILRNGLKFNGIIFTDDLQMKSVADRYTLKDRVTLAVNAGDTVLVFSNNMGTYDPELFFQVRAIIMAGVKDGSIDQSKIDDAYDRIMKIKQNF